VGVQIDGWIRILSLIPEFELGLWNAWILVIPMLIIFFYTMKVTSVRESGEAGDFELTKKQKRIINAVFLPIVVSLVYAVFLPCMHILERLIACFKDPKVGAVQGRVTVLNEPSTLVTRLVALERTGGYRVDQFARESLGLIPQFGGTGEGSGEV
jgi:hypothetical protein